MSKNLLPLDTLIAGYLREGIDEAGLSYRQIASKTGMSINRLGIILRQEPPPATVGEIGLIASTFGASPSELVTQAELTIATRGGLDLVVDDPADEIYDTPDSDSDNV